jgi:hypothetical protein
MQGASIIIGNLPSGGFKAFYWGQADGHIMDWRGCNFRYAPLDKQPLRGFKTKEEAEAFARSQFQNDQQVRDAGRRKSGRHLSDYNPMDFDVLNLGEPK